MHWCPVGLEQRPVVVCGVLQFSGGL